LTSFRRYRFKYYRFDILVLFLNSFKRLLI